ncbi:hypothetical protein CHISP_2704 [Chitinispirillum alkaliphilum]|nr:hypothetical protein CHISP_2704 [Chitinispirillum alkaliphilum]
MKRGLFLVSALLFTFTSRVDGHFRPDTSLVVTTINEYYSDGIWSLIEREIIGYDDQRRELFRAHESPIFFEEDRRTLWNYDEDGIRAEKVYLLEGFDYSWRITRRDSIYSHPLSDTVLIQHLTDDQFENAYREITNYDQAGRIIEEIRYTMMDDEWVAQIRNTYVYDARGNLIEEISQQRQTEDQQLFNDRREIHSYENDRIITSNIYDWNRDLLQWVRISQRHYSYYAVNKKRVTKELTQIISGEERINTRRVFDTTDVAGLTTGLLTQFWRDGEWENQLLRQFSYDFLGNVTEDLLRTYENGVWTDQERIRYEYAYYQDGTSARQLATQQPHHKFSVTETRNEIAFTGLRDAGNSVVCRIYDLQGRLVFSKTIQLNHQNTIRIRKDWAGASGMRLLQLSSREHGVIYQRRLGVGRN